MGGERAHPSYEEVCAGTTGHMEVVQVEFDPEKISYGELLEVFWENINPTQKGGQFCDIGSQYKTAIFFDNDEQKREAERSRANIGRSVGEVATEILPALQFWPAEEYHQKFYRKNREHYERYKKGSGR